MVHTWEHQRMMYIKMVLVMVMVTVPDINRNLSGKWYGYGNSTCSAWLSYEGCTEEERVKGKSYRSYSHNSVVKVANNIW